MISTSFDIILTEARWAPASCRTSEEAQWDLAVKFAPSHCRLTQLFAQPTPHEAAKAVHNALVYGDWRSKAGIT